MNFKEAVGRFSEVFSGMDPKSICMYGSAVSFPGSDFNDIDVYCSDEKSFASALWKSGQGDLFHPWNGEIPVEKFHEYQSFRQLCSTVSLDGGITRGDQWLDPETNKSLVFNERSIACFRDKQNVDKIFKKCLDRGMTVTEEEKRRSIALITGNEKQIAEEALGDLRYLSKDPSVVIAGGYIRDWILGRNPKDLDVFCLLYGAWQRLCDELLATGWQEEMIQTRFLRRVNVRKFHKEGFPSLDVILYQFVAEPQHVVETFDFSVNCLWYDRTTDSVKGPLEGSLEMVLMDIAHRRLRVGKNLWYRAGAGRALKRWQRFRSEGYEPTEEDKELYKSYVQRFIK
jgi:hypothetical protein